MKQFEVQTPALKDAVAACKQVFDGTVDGDDARHFIGASNATTRAVAEELKVRLAMPKLVAHEAKLIEHEAKAEHSRKLEKAD